MFFCSLLSSLIKRLTETMWAAYFIPFGRLIISRPSLISSPGSPVIIPTERRRINIGKNDDWKCRRCRQRFNGRMRRTGWPFFLIIFCGPAVRPARTFMAAFLSFFRGQTLKGSCPWMSFTPRHLSGR